MAVSNAVYNDNLAVLIGLWSKVEFARIYLLSEKRRLTRMSEVLVFYHSSFAPFKQLFGGDRMLTACGKLNCNIVHLLNFHYGLDSFLQRYCTFSIFIKAEKII